MKDLTTGHPGREIFFFSLPLLLSMALQQIYNITDSVIIGQITGSDGLAAVGAAYPITLIFIAIATGAAMGCSVVVGNLYGSGQTKELKCAIFTSVISMLALGALLSLLGIFLARPVLVLLGTPENVLKDAVAYLRIYSAGLVANFVYNIANAVYTGLGDAKRPLYFLLVSSVLNVILDLIAVGPLGWGVSGAAWATTVSQIVAALLATGILIKKIKQLETKEKVPVFSFETLKTMSRFSVPSIIQQCTIAFSHILVQRVVNSFGSSVMAGYEAASKVHNFAYMCMNTLGTALSSFVAQNIGAGKISRVKQGFKYSSLITFAMSCGIILILQLIPSQLVGLFMDEGSNAASVEVGVMFMRIVSVDYLLISFVITFGGLFRGMGRVNIFLFVSVIDIIFRVGLCYIFCFGTGMDYTGLYWPWFFGTGVDLLAEIIFYRRMLKNELKSTDLTE